MTDGVTYSRTSCDISWASDWSRWPSRPIRSPRYIVTCTRKRVQQDNTVMSDLGNPGRTAASACVDKSTEERIQTGGHMDTGSGIIWTTQPGMRSPPTRIPPPPVLNTPTPSHQSCHPRPPRLSANQVNSWVALECHNACSGHVCPSLTILLCKAKRQHLFK